MSKRTAFAAADCGQMDGGPVKGKPWGVGVVTENEAGYRPMNCYAFSTFELAQACAERLNKRAGMSQEDASKIVASSFPSSFR